MVYGKQLNELFSFFTKMYIFTRFGLFKQIYNYMESGVGDIYILQNVFVPPTWT